MADNSTMGGTTDLIRDKDRSGVKTQIVGLDIGIGTGTEALMSASNPLPVNDADVSVSGTITATDAVLGTYVNDGTLKTGTPTANSYVALPLTGGKSAYLVMLTGTFGSGTVWQEVSPNSTNGVDGSWTTALGRQSGINNTVLDESLTVAGIYRGNAAGMTYVRWRITGATTPSVTVVGRASAGTGAVFINASIPAGANAIGSLTATSSRIGGYSAISTAYTAGAAVAAAAYSALSGAIDNSTALDLYDDLELVVTFAVAPVANTLVEVYLVPSLDGTNYANSAPPSPNLYVGGFPVAAVTTAQRLVFRGVPLPPGLFQYVLRNGTAQSLPITTTVMRRRPYRLQLG